mmetsp:Transcript_66970/g.106500  ORF Transcript_66970/g.106500 Transcript_66970/m.106500 type:complete len:255 (+) Transcript_66970:82-846(+)
MLSSHLRVFLRLCRFFNGSASFSSSILSDLFVRFWSCSISPRARFRPLFLDLVVFLLLRFGFVSGFVSSSASAPDPAEPEVNILSLSLASSASSFFFSSAPCSLFSLSSSSLSCSMMDSFRFRRSALKFSAETSKSGSSAITSSSDGWSLRCPFSVPCSSVLCSVSFTFLFLFLLCAFASSPYFCRSISEENKPIFFCFCLPDNPESEAVVVANNDWSVNTRVAAEEECLLRFRFDADVILRGDEWWRSRALEP